MQTIIRNIGDFNNLIFDVDLTQYGKTAADVSEIVFVVKKKVEDTNYVFEKKMSDSDITKAGTTIMEVQVLWAETEYGAFEPDQKYIAGLYAQFTGEPEPDQHIDQDFNLKIVERVLNV